MSVEMHLGDCLEILPTLPANSVDAIVTDPPYMINFMGKAFDREKDNPAASVEVWAEALRVAKPGAHLLAFGGTRKHHRMMCAIEDAGWEIRDCLMWVYGSGFPKSHDISKAIDKHLGAEREVIGVHERDNLRKGKAGFRNLDGTNVERGQIELTAPATDEAKRFTGFGSALKPAWEPIILAMKPLDGTFANNALTWGVGGLNIDASRIGIEGDDDIHRKHAKSDRTGQNTCFSGLGEHSYQVPQGRWPANLILSDDAAALLDEMSGVSKSTDSPRNKSGTLGGNGKYNGGVAMVTHGHNDTGGASRFFLRVAHDEDDVPSRMAYVPKASRRDRSSDGTVNNTHPTCKPQKLMRWLVRLICPPGGTVLDPFLGSGTTGVAAVLEGFNFVGIDNEAEYLTIAEKRIAHAAAQAETHPQLPLLALSK